MRLKLYKFVLVIFGIKGTVDVNSSDSSLYLCSILSKNKGIMPCFILLAKWLFSLKKLSTFWIKKRGFFHIVSLTRVKNGPVINRTCHSINGGELIVTPTVSLRFQGFPETYFQV